MARVHTACFALYNDDSAAAKGCFWKMTPTRGITRCHLFLVIEDSMGYVESVVVVK